jgi:nicotinamide-nucleotide amidase
VKPAELIAELDKRNLKLALAESLTGGLLCSELVTVPGASKVVLGSIVAYQTGLKSAALGVSADLLNKVGAVDPEVALKMAEGVRSRMALQLLLSTDQVIGVSTTGVAGPESQDGKPVGMVYVAISGMNGDRVWEESISGERADIRSKTVEQVFARIGEYLGLKAG